MGMRILNTQYGTETRDWDSDNLNKNKGTFLHFWKGSAYIYITFFVFNGHTMVTLRCPDSGNTPRKTKS